MRRFGILFGLLLAACSGGHGAARQGAAAPSAGTVGAKSRVARAYPLDDVRRSSKSGAASCPKLELRKFGGAQLRFVPAVRVVEPFRKRLLELERIVNEVSERVYSRPPSEILVAASYGCRTVRGKKRKLSEHALGNAIDIKGFRFSPLPRARARGVPPGLAEGFEVRVDQHWKGRGNSLRRRHARFLEELTSALVERDTFRTLLGPAHRDHADHFHFDMAPQRYVDL